MIPKFSIGIPTINRAYLLMPALMYYAHDFPNTRIVIIDNGQQNMLLPGSSSGSTAFEIHRIVNGNLGVAGSWNYLIKKIFEDLQIFYAVIVNDDIYWGREQEDFNVFLWEFENTQKHAPNSDKGFIMIPKDEKYDWSVFVISRAAWNTIGEFDKNFFPAYFEDKDYAYRAKLAGVAIHPILRAPARFMHSGSITKDSRLNESPNNREYYIKKWGGDPGHEEFTEPFDGKTINSNGVFL